MTAFLVALGVLLLLGGLSLWYAIATAADMQDEVDERGIRADDS